MEVKNLFKIAQFSSQEMKKINLFESPRMFCDIYCLEAGQKQKIHSHKGNDKIYYVVEGMGKFTIGSETLLLQPGEITCAFSQVPHGVENTGENRLICLVLMAPNPNLTA